MAGRNAIGAGGISVTTGLASSLAWWTRIQTNSFGASTLSTGAPRARTTFYFTTCYGSKCHRPDANRH
eukprot:symbB.v1.2.031806.t1/scaffold3733.1/size51286/4